MSVRYLVLTVDMGAGKLCSFQSFVMKHKPVGGNGAGAQALCLGHRPVHVAWNQSSSEGGNEEGELRAGKEALSALFTPIACRSVIALLLYMIPVELKHDSH